MAQWIRRRSTGIDHIQHSDERMFAKTKHFLLNDAFAFVFFGLVSFISVVNDQSPLRPRSFVVGVGDDVFVCVRVKYKKAT